MSRKSLPAPRYIEVSEAKPGPPVVLIALLSFAAGAGTMFFAMRNSVPPTKTVAAPAATPAAQTPDISTLPPAQGAVMLANWHYDRQNWSEAIAQYERAIASGMDNPDVRTDLGNCYRFLGVPQKALDQYNIAQSQNPRHENSLFNKAGLYAEVLQDRAKAISTTRDFLNRFPQSPGADRARKLIADLEKGPEAGDAANNQRMVEWVTQPKEPHKNSGK